MPRARRTARMVPPGQPSPQMSGWLDKDLYEQILAYHRAVDPTRPWVETIRELLRFAVSLDLDTAQLTAIRVVTALRTRNYLSDRIHKILGDLRDEMAIALPVLTDAEIAAEVDAALDARERRIARAAQLPPTGGF